MLKMKLLCRTVSVSVYIYNLYIRVSLYKCLHSIACADVIYKRICVGAALYRRMSIGAYTLEVINVFIGVACDGFVIGTSLQDRVT